MAIWIGLVGSFGAGCSSAAKLLETQKGFQRVSLSDVLREEFEKEKGRLPSEDREELQDYGDELRERHGADYLAKKAREHVTESEKSVVFDSIRNPEEVRYLRRDNPLGFFLFAIHADQASRFERLRRDTPELELSKFERDDARDSGMNEKSYGQQVQDASYLADIYLDNTVDWHEHLKNKEAFTTRLFSFLAMLQKAPLRDIGEHGDETYIWPTNDELAMQMAYSVSLQARCYSRQVGAVIARTSNESSGNYSDLSILAAACNQVPETVEHCRDQFGYCYRKQARGKILGEIRNRFVAGVTDKHPEILDLRPEELTLAAPQSFKHLEQSRNLHAEERAVLQIAKLGGQSLRGATLYTTAFPCNLCANKIVQVGIKKVVYVEAYPLKEATDTLRSGEVDVQRFTGVSWRAFGRVYAPRGGI